MGTAVKDKTIIQLLRSIRTAGTKDNEDVKELLFRFTGEEEWSYQQCRNFYEFILRNYIDDKYELELLLAVSGLLEGYKSIKTATERRVKYLKHLEDVESSSKYRGLDPETLRKSEDERLEYIAINLQNDLESGIIGQLVAKWAAISNEIPTSQDKADLNYPPIEEIFPTAKDIVLTPGEIFQLKVAVIPKEAINAPLNYVSLDTSLVTVSAVGMLYAGNGRQKGLGQSIRDIIGRKKQQSGNLRSTDVIIQSESGISARKSVAVDISGRTYNVFPEFDINEFVPTYRVEQRVRLAGTDAWKTNVQNVQVGDKLEFRIQYINISDEVQRSVMIRDVLPKNLSYISGTTVLTNAAYTLNIDQDTLVTTGINIGHYEPGANALVDFTAEVIDVDLRNGSNTLVNWSQCGIGRVTLQGYATVQLYMKK